MNAAGGPIGLRRTALGARSIIEAAAPVERFGLSEPMGRLQQGGRGHWGVEQGSAPADANCPTEPQTLVAAGAEVFGLYRFGSARSKDSARRRGGSR